MLIFDLHLKGQTDVDNLLLNASFTGDSAAIDSALHQGADPNIMSYNGITPLMYVTQLGNARLIIQLLDAGALPDKHGEEWPPALYTAAEAGNEEAVGILLAAGAEPDIPDGLGRTALMAAVSYNDFRIAWMLLEAGANPNHQDAKGNTPLHHATFTGSYECAALLLSRNSKGDIPSHEGNTPLMMAAYFDDLAFGELLLANQANPHNRNDLGLNAADIATLQGHYAFVRFLIDQENDTNRTEKPRSEEAIVHDNARISSDPEGIRQDWTGAAKLALKTGDRRLYTIIKKSSGGKFPKPVIHETAICTQVLFNTKTHLEGFAVGIREAHSGIGIGVSWLTRIKPDKQLRELARQTYQFREYRNAIMITLDKKIEPVQSRPWKSGLQTFFSLGYSWGNYRGSLIEAEDKSLWYAGLGYTWRWSALQGTLGYAYFPDLPGEQSPHMTFLSVGFAIPSLNQKKYNISL